MVERALKRQKMIEMQQSLINHEQLTTCTNCDQWSQNHQRCDKWNAKPPAEVIVVGCIDWTASIPF